nr:Flp family type IVb pilin [uncultured Rhodopila sp.]
MFKSVKRIRAFWSDRSGVTAVEYGLIAAIMAAVIVGVMATLSGGLTTSFGSISGTLSSPAPKTGT